jgi:CheY-like chemotaxis protein/anti-sigma regulatory factor (Ser/Thr protein kinase)
VLARNVDAALSAVEEIFSALIEISRMDAGRLEPEVSAFPLAKIFDQLKVEFEPMAREKGLEFRVLATSAWVRSDRRLLRRVLQNLVSNAIKYTRTGSVLLGTRRRGGSLVVQVVDTGPGIPADKQELIFKEFERLEGPGSNVRGVGLGLSIVERIGRILDHPIGLASNALCGSTFSVTVPRAEPRRVAPVEAAAAPVAGSLAGCVALCVDNEPAVLQGMQALLSGWGCKVLTAVDSHQALAALRTAETVPNVILADYHLDVGTGLDVIAALRREARLDIPAVVITADHSAEVQREVRRLRYGLLRKPLKAAALRAILAQYVQRRAAAAE